MGLRFFADHCVPMAAVRFLREAGHEVLCLRDHLATDAPDRDVIEAAQERHAILLSLNGDFADIVSFPPKKYCGIVSLQVKNRPEVLPQILERLQAFLLANEGIQKFGGKLFLVEAHRIRIRG